MPRTLASPSTKSAAQCRHSFLGKEVSAKTPLSVMFGLCEMSKISNALIDFDIESSEVSPRDTHFRILS